MARIAFVVATLTLATAGAAHAHAIPLHIVPPPGWLPRIAEIAKQNDVLLIADEVQTGIGRTGKMFAVEREGVVPDVITLAKALGSGIPIGAAVFDAKLDFGVQGAHSNTFGGNPVACASAMATLDVMDEEGLVANAARLGKRMSARLDAMKERFDIIGDHRGVGLMHVTEFVSDPKRKTADPKVRNAIVKDAYEHGVVVLPRGESGIRYIPALNIPDELLEAGLDIIEGCIGRAAS